MLHTNRHFHSGWASPHNHLSEHKTLQRFTVLAVGVILILASVAIFSSSQAFGNGGANHDLNSAGSEPASRALPDLDSADAKNQLMEYYARDLYNSEHIGTANAASSPLGSPDSTQTLLQSLQQDQPQDKRDAAMNSLIGAPPAVVPALLDALTDPNPGVRRGAAEILGARRAPEAEDSLFFATFDSDPSVRAAAVKALGELGAMYTLPRLQWLQVTETDSDVQLAARLAEKQVYTHVAATLGVRPGDLRVIAVALANERVYAATKGDLYTPNNLDWERVGALPDTPTALAAAGNDGRMLYLGTASSGVFRSIDGGLTWQAINRNLPAANPFAVTALTVSPGNDRQIFIALAANSGATPLMPFGLFRSLDGGASWSPLAQWNVDDVTTRLVVDPNEPARLLGLTDSGAWQYPLAKANAPDP